MSEAMSDMVANLREHLPSIDLDTSALADHLPKRQNKSRSKSRKVGVLASLVGAAAVFGIVLRRHHSPPASNAAMYTPPLPRP